MALGKVEDLIGSFVKLHALKAHVISYVAFDPHVSDSSLID